VEPPSPGKPPTPGPSPQEQGEGSKTEACTLIPDPSPSKGEGSQTSTNAPADSLPLFLGGGLGGGAFLPILITLLGLALRLWGIGWSLPDARHPLATYHPDELVNLGAARAADIPHGQFDIQFYNYGAFYFYLVSFAQTVASGWGLIPAAPQNPTPAQLAAENAALFLTGRVVTALLGTATILVIFALGHRGYGRRAGLLAALLYALAPLAVVHAHFLTVDVPATFFVALALLWAVRLLAVPPIYAAGCRLPQAGPGHTGIGPLATWKDYVLAGVWVGLAAATKYTAGLVLIAPIVAHLLAKAPGACNRHRAAQWVVLLCLTALVFLLACPGPLLNLEAFWEGTYPGSGVRYELLEHARTGHGDLFIATGPGWWYHLVISLNFGLGLPLLLLAIAGFLFACVRRSKPDKILLAFFLLAYLAASASAVRFARYMIPLFPVLCVWVARLVTEPFPRRSVRQAMAAVGALVTVGTAVYAFSLTRLMALRDPRDTVADRLEQTAPQGASVAFAKIPWFYSPPLSPLFGALAAPTRARAAEETTRFQLRIPPAEWDQSVLTPPPDYVLLSNLETLHAVDRLRLAPAVSFVQAIPADYRRHVFPPPAPVYGLPRFGPIVPEDLLYIMPTLTVYAKRQSARP